MTPPTPPDPTRLPPAFAAALEAYSAREQGRELPPPDGFAIRAAVRATTRFRWVRRAKWAAGLATAVVLFAGSYAVWDRLRPAPPVVITPVAPVAPLPQTAPKLSESLSEAGEAIASLSRTTADKAVGPTRSLASTAEAFRLPTPKTVAPTVDPAAQSLAAVPSAARSSLEPLASNTRRAFTLFLRDTGLQASN